MAKILIIVGILLVVLGLVLLKAPFLVSWFGRLPGDIYYSKDSVTIFIPITSMIVISVVISLLLQVINLK